MKGSLPIPYIVAAILAIAVIVVVAYIFLTQSGYFSNVIDRKYCEAKCLEYCNTAKDEQSWSQFDSRCAGILTTCTCS